MKVGAYIRPRYVVHCVRQCDITIATPISIQFKLCVVEATYS